MTMQTAESAEEQAPTTENFDRSMILGVIYLVVRNFGRGSSNWEFWAYFSPVTLMARKGSNKLQFRSKVSNIVVWKRYSVPNFS